MKTKVDPLIKLLDFKQGEASRALLAARQRHAALEQERDGLAASITREEQSFDLAQRAPMLPEEHEFHHRWVDRLRVWLKEKEAEAEAARLEVERCREALAEVHLELKTIEKFKSNLEDQVREERRVLEAKELDEIAAQNHFRQED